MPVFGHFILFSVCDLDSSIKSNARITVPARKPTTAFMSCEPNVFALKAGPMKAGDLSEG